MNNNLLAGSGGLVNPLFEGTNYISQIQSQEGGESFLVAVLPKLVGLLLVFGSVAFFFMFLWGAVSWIISGGDKAHVEASKNRITNALIGFVLMISVFAVSALIETFFKINILTIDIGPLVIQ